MMKFFNETTFTNKNETFDPVLHIHTLNYAIFQNNKVYWHHSQPLAMSFRKWPKHLTFLEQKKYLTVEGDKF